MIKAIQNWLDVRKQYRLEQQRQEIINVAKVIISDIMRELVKYDIECKFEIALKGHNFLLWYSENNQNLCFKIYRDSIEIIFDEKNQIGVYKHLKWYQLVTFTKNSTKKKFYHAEDAVKAISTMIIMGEAI